MFTYTLFTASILKHWGLVTHTWVSEVGLHVFSYGLTTWSKPRNTTNSDPLLIELYETQVVSLSSIDAQMYSNVHIEILLEQPGSNKYWYFRGGLLFDRYRNSLTIKLPLSKIKERHLKLLFVKCQRYCKCLVLYISPNCKNIFTEHKYLYHELTVQLFIYE